MGTHVELAAPRPSLATGVALGLPKRLEAMRAAARVPLRDGRFWLIQALVFSIAGLHNALEGLNSVPRSGMICFVPTSLFFMPVVYAAVNFGRRGSVATAVWCTIITIPNTVFWHSGFDRYGEMAQMGFVDFAAVFLGMRVDEERRAYARVAAVSRALELSRLRYRELFESAREGMLVLDECGRIIECNAAARALVQAPQQELNLRHLSEVFPPEAARHIMDQASTPEKRPHAIPLGERGTNEMWVEPLCTPLDGDAPTTQVLLRNVTQQRRRQIGLETYTAQVHEAQEDERRRIAQEIHDETVQSLVLLCRELDELEDRFSKTSHRLVDSLRQARTHAEQIVEKLRVLIRGIRPPLLDDLGLAPAVERLLTDLASHSPIRTNLVVTGEARRAPHGVELAMLRIAQEAVHNSERHGMPSYIEIRIKYEYGHVELEVRDDGRGFVAPPDPSDFAKPGKWGIIGMHERAREVGGELHVSSTPGVGTLVSAAFGI